MKTEKQIAAAAAEFAERWKGRGYERGESQPFWIDLLSNVFGIETPTDGFITFEEHHKVDASNYVDGCIRSTRVLIEQKSKDKDLRAPIRQSDGALLNPFQQARRYVVGLPVSEHPRWIVTCNFKEFLVYDMEQPNGEPEQILLENLGKEYYRLQFLVDAKNEHLSKEMEVSMQAGEIVGKIYEALLKQYDDDSPEALRWLNILCVRIVFCLYAEDAGVFTHDQFHDYLIRYDAEDLRNALIRLFDHIFPKQYLVDNGFDKHEYNQVANYAYLDTPINIKIGKKAPKDYLNEALNAIKNAQETSFKAIKSESEFYQNLDDNCIPADILEMDYTSYQSFLEARRAKMTELIKSYYYSL